MRINLHIGPKTLLLEAFVCFFVSAFDLAIPFWYRIFIMSCGVFIVGYDARVLDSYLLKRKQMQK